MRLYGKLTHPIISYNFNSMLAKQNKTKRKMHQPKKSDWGLIEGKFVNTRVLLGLFMRNRVRGCLRLLGILVRHVQEKFRRPLKFISLVVKFLSLLTQEDRTKLLVRVNLQRYMNKPRSTLAFKNLHSISPLSDFFGWCIFRFVLFCLANMLTYRVFGGPFSLRRVSCTSQTGTAKSRDCR